MHQLGVALAGAVLIDATIFGAVLLPAAMEPLGHGASLLVIAARRTRRRQASRVDTS